MKKQNIFLLTGENTYELQCFLDTWKASAKKKYGEYNVTEYDFAETSPIQLLSEVSAPPFFGDGKRIFFLKNFPPPPPSRPFSEQKKKEILAFTTELSTLPSDVVVVCVSPKPDKRMAAYKTFSNFVGTVHTFAAWERERSGALSIQGRKAAQEWIQQTTQKHGGNISPSQALFLLEFCGADPWKLAREIEKLSLYTRGRQIEESDIRSLCIPTEEMQNFAFSSAFQTGNREKVLHVFHQLLSAGEAPQAIMARDIVPTFRQLLQVKLAEETGVSAKEVGLHPFVFSKLKGFARQFSRSAISKAHDSLLRIDIDSKTGALPITPEQTTLFALRIERILLDFFRKKESKSKK